MKKFVSIAVVAATLLTGCNGDKLKTAQAENEQLKGDLRETLATQDSLLVLVNDISDGMAQIKDLEKSPPLREILENRLHAKSRLKMT